jgi:hypothetical protein
VKPSASGGIERTMTRTATISFAALALACSNDARVGETLVSGSSATNDEAGDSSTSPASETTATDDTTGDTGLDPVTYECSSIELAPSSIGCSFVAGLHVSGGVAFTNMGGEAALVTITSGDGASDSVEIDPGESETFVWSPTQELPVGGVFTGLVRTIESDQPLQAWQFNPVAPGNDNDASILLPVSSLGTRHRLASYTGEPITAPGMDPEELVPVKNGHQVLVVHATRDDTTVEVTLAGSAARTSGEGLALDVAAGEATGSIELDRGETLVLHDDYELSDEAPQAWDWTGSLVESDQPIAVYMTSVAMVPWDFAGLAPDWICCQDTMAAAIPPTDVLGDRYVAVKTLALGDEEDVFRIVANEDGTAVDIRGEESTSVTLDAGEFAEFRTRTAAVVESDRAFMLVHYTPSSHVAFPEGMGGIETADCGHVETPGDPGMTIVFATENWLDDYLFVQGAAGLGGGWCHDHATIVSGLDDWAGIRLSDEPLPEPTAIGDSGFGFVRVLLDDDVSRLRAPNGVGVQLEVYGYRDDGSYMYPGGVKLEPINPVP